MSTSTGPVDLTWNLSLTICLNGHHVNTLHYPRTFNIIIHYIYHAIVPLELEQRKVFVFCFSKSTKYSEHNFPHFGKKSRTKSPFFVLPKSLIVDDAHKDFGGHFDPVDARVEGLGAVVVVASILQLTKGIYSILNITLLCKINILWLGNKSWN